MYRYYLGSNKPAEQTYIFIIYMHHFLIVDVNSYVGNFLSRHDRNTDETTAKLFTNVFVKNFGETLDDEKLSELFAKLGEITSVYVPKNEEGKPRGFGFINFKNPEDALKVSHIFRLNGF